MQSLCKVTARSPCELFPRLSEFLGRRRPVRLSSTQTMARRLDVPSLNSRVATGVGGPVPGVRANQRNCVDYATVSCRVVGMCRNRVNRDSFVLRIGSLSETALD